MLFSSDSETETEAEAEAETETETETATETETETETEKETETETETETQTETRTKATMSKRASEMDHHLEGQDGSSSCSSDGGQTSVIGVLQISLSRKCIKGGQK